MTTTIPDPVSLFDSLAAPENLPPWFTAIHVPNRQRDLIGKNHKGEPVVLIVATGPPLPVAPIALAHLSVDHSIRCRIQEPDGTTIEELFSVARCTNGDRTMYEYFLRSTVPIIQTLPPAPTCQDISKAVSYLAELFSRLSQPSRKSVQGVWAELFLIASSTRPVTLIEAWHKTPHDLYDYARGVERIEVKSASGGVRAHHFSFDQLHPKKPYRVLVASMLVEQSNNGKSIYDLIEDVQERIVTRPDLIVRINDIVGAALGSTWRQASRLKFDSERARSSLLFYEPRSIPSVPAPLPLGLSKLHFQSDLSFANPLALQTLKNGNLLFDALPGVAL